MWGDDFNAKVEEIKSRTDIIDVVSRHLTLRKSGRNYFGLCPFHNEKTPSFTVRPEKQTFHCFGCGKGGDVITFLMETERLSYMEAVRRLASQCGVTLPPRASDKQETSPTAEILKLNRLAETFFMRNLNGEAARPVRDYLTQRAIPQEAWKTFHLGFAPEGWNNLKGHLERSKVSPAGAYRAGLLSQRDGDGGYYDRFRNRLIFPIHNTMGDVIAFGGRVISTGEPKYLNSPETPVYTKGNNFYGLFQAREHVAREEAVIIVEGYMDLLALWSGGIHNVVATLGTALTTAQARLLRRYCSLAYIIFDGDSAGQKAMVKSWEVLSTGGIEAKAVALPTGQDPDDYLRSHNAAELREELARANSLDEFFFYQTVGKAKSTAGLIASVREIAPLVAEISDDLARNLFIRMMAEKSGLNEEAIKKEISAVTMKRREDTFKRERGKPSEERTETAPSLAATTLEDIDEWELEIIKIMAEFPSTIEIVEEERVLPLFTSKYLKDVGEMLIVSLNVTGRADVVAILRRLNAGGATGDEVLRRVTAGAHCERENSKKTVREMIKSIKKRHYQSRAKQLRAELTEAEKAGEHERVRSIIMRLQELKEEERKQLGSRQ